MSSFRDLFPNKSLELIHHCDGYDIPMEDFIKENHLKEGDVFFYKLDFRNGCSTGYSCKIVNGGVVKKVVFLGF